MAVPRSCWCSIAACIGDDISEHKTRSPGSAAAWVFLSNPLLSDGLLKRATKTFATA